MRIIAGELRGRRIAAPSGRGTRPMLDRVREAMFSTLAPWLEGARVLDLFAGSGSLGLEAISRGARELRLVESDPSVLRLLKDNVEQLGVADRVSVHPGDALEPYHWGTLPGAPGELFAPDIVFLDPPYPMMKSGPGRARVFQAIVSLLHALAPEGVLCLHAPRGLLDPQEFPPAELVVRPYGTNDLWYVQRSAQGDES